MGEEILVYSINVAKIEVFSFFACNKQDTAPKTQGHLQEIGLPGPLYTLLGVIFFDIPGASA